MMLAAREFVYVRVLNLCDEAHGFLPSCRKGRGSQGAKRTSRELQEYRNSRLDTLLLQASDEAADD